MLLDRTGEFEDGDVLLEALEGLQLAGGRQHLVHGVVPRRLLSVRVVRDHVRCPMARARVGDLAIGLTDHGADALLGDDLGVGRQVVMRPDGRRLESVVVPAGDTDLERDGVGDGDERQGRTDDDQRSPCGLALLVTREGLHLPDLLSLTQLAREVAEQRDDHHDQVVRQHQLHETEAQDRACGPRKQDGVLADRLDASLSDHLDDPHQDHDTSDDEQQQRDHEDLVLVDQGVDQIAEAVDGAAGLAHAQDPLDLDGALIPVRRAVGHRHDADVCRAGREGCTDQREVLLVVAPHDQPVDQNRDQEVDADVFEHGDEPEDPACGDESAETGCLEGLPVEPEARDTDRHHDVLEPADPVGEHGPAVDGQDAGGDQSPLVADELPQPEAEEQQHDERADGRQDASLRDAGANQPVPQPQQREVERRVVQIRLGGEAGFGLGLQQVVMGHVGADHAVDTLVPVVAGSSGDVPEAQQAGDKQDAGQDEGESPHSSYGVH